MQNRRRYIRLNSVFPIEFGLLYLSPGSDAQQYQGFTCNISDGGLCITVRNLKEKDAGLISSKSVKLNLIINIPLKKMPVFATAGIAWYKKDPATNTHYIGISYEKIQQADKERIINHARRLKWLPRITASVIVLFVAVLVMLSSYHIKVKRDNQRLVKDLVEVSEIKSALKRQLDEIRLSRGELESEFSTRQKQIDDLRQEITGVESKTDTETGRLQSELKLALSQQKELQERLAKLSVESKIATDMARKGSEARLDDLNSTISAFEMEIEEVTKKSQLKISSLQGRLDQLANENEAFRLQLDITQQGEVSLEQHLARIRGTSGILEEASIEKMMGWIRTHQTKRTGLVLSYEGDKDLADWGFTYDQALACQAFLISGDVKRAEAILNFYKNRAKGSKGLFYNAYDVRSGEPCEHVIHSGPNVWIAISACQYVNSTGDRAFLKVAEDIAANMIALQRRSSDGSIKGGPDVDWVSTEHNLDAYAMFKMLFKLTDDNKYGEAAQRALSWLKDVGYNKPEGRFMRGRGDATIATDTFSWAIAAIGPRTLMDNAMNPDGIMEFAENECKVKTQFYRPDERAVDIVGFDFAKAQNLGRGGVVSTEWTAQMVVAFQLMADYYRQLADAQKEQVYRLKAEYYLAQLGKMVISSPSPTGQGEGCLPYASIDNVDTGHGWRVAKGRRTGSVAATIYYIFAHKNYNPLGDGSRGDRSHLGNS